VRVQVTLKQMAEQLILSCRQWEAEWKHHFGKSKDITAVFYDNMNQ